MKRPLPQWYLDEPAEWAGSEFYLRAFFRLSTTREIGAGTGPLPWNHVMEYADHVGLDHEMTEVFEGVMYQLDDVYQDWQEEQRKDKTPTAKQTSPDGKKMRVHRGRYGK